jgi:uncharacterized protein
MSRKLFVNLPVKNIESTKQFFKALGFTFNAKFTDDKAACMVISEEASAMLLAEPFFKSFTSREICDSTHVEVSLCLSCESREEVDAMVAKAVAAGGTDPGGTQDHGFMYGRGFEDLDHHHWEAVWMDPKAVM